MDIQMTSRKWTRIRERVIEVGLFTAALTSVFATAAIAWTLFKESYIFFQRVSPFIFFSDHEWTPLFSNPRYGVWPLISGTLLTTFVALSVAVPAGLLIAMLLSEYIPSRLREFLKPILELLSAVPTVVYGYFALLFVSPWLQRFFPELPGFNVLSAGLVMGVMILPYISSLTEDAMRAVPMYVREGSYALGATKLQTARRVVLPAATSGITAAIILGISRAIGETMIVAIAAGMQPNPSFNPLQPAQTMTAYIVQVSLGDLPHESMAYQTIFAVGFTLCAMTFVFNLLGIWVKRRFQEIY